MQDFLKAIRKFNRSIWLFLLTWAAVGFCYLGLQGVLLNLYLLRLGYGLEFIGLLTGAGQVMWGIAALPAGMISSRIGLKRSLMIAQLMLAGGIGVQLLAESLPKGIEAPLLFAGALIAWSGAAFLVVTSLPYLMAVTTPETRNYAFSAQQAVIAIAGFGGSLTAGVIPGMLAGGLGVTLEDATPYRLTLLLVPAAYCASVFAFRRAQTIAVAASTAANGEKRAVPWGIFVFLTLLVVLQTVGEGTLRAFFNVYLDMEMGVPTVQIGTVMALVALVPVIAALAAPALLNRRGVRVIMMLAAMAAALFLLLIALTPWWLAAAVAFIVINCMIVLMNIGRNIFAQEAVDVEWRTTASAILTIGTAAGWAASAAGGGYLAGTVGFRGVFLIGAVGTLLSTVLLMTRTRPAPAVAAVPVSGEQAEQ